jgi:hypothetical protein
MPYLSVHEFGEKKTHYLHQIVLHLQHIEWYTKFSINGLIAVCSNLVLVDPRIRLRAHTRS